MEHCICSRYLVYTTYIRAMYIMMVYLTVVFAQAPSWCGHNSLRVSWAYTGEFFFFAYGFPCIIPQPSR